MMEARMGKIMADKGMPETFKLSIQQVMDCSAQNQGCDGGYPYLVEKFGEEYHLLDDACRPYKEDSPT